MRFLFAFVGGHGHLGPLLPLARTARHRGHEVSFACRPSMVDPAAALGFDAVGVGPDVVDGTELVGGAGIGELVAPDAEREELVMRHGFAHSTAIARASGLLELARRDRPDLIVADEVDFGAFVAAERLGIPYASVIVLAAGGFARPDVVAEPLADVRRRFGLPLDPQLAMLHRHLVLAPVPPSYRDPDHPLPPNTVAIKPAALDAQSERTEGAWSAGRGARRHVYVTLGTVFNLESGDLFDRLMAATAAVDADVLVTVGHQLDPDRFGPAPPDVRVERFVEQAAVFPGADVVVSHGGSGSVIGALAHGAPLVVLPMGADQPHNARRCEALGVGRSLDATRATARDLADAIDEVGADGSFRRRARVLAAEAWALPGSDHAVDLLEALRP